MNALTWPLLHFVWQGALIAAALWLSLRLARASRTRYALAAAALLLMASAPVLTYLDRPVAAVVTMASPVAFSAPAGWDWLMLVPYAWALGVLLFSVRLGRAALAMRAFRVGAVRVENAWPHLVTGAVRIFESARVRVPAQSGIWRPVIWLPLGLLAQMPPAQVEAILAHEMAHIRRWDYLVNLLQVVVETLLFYHPGVWWVSSVMRRERELCADELALELIGDRAALAAALLTLEESRQAGFATAANGGELKGRIERIVSAVPSPRGSVWPALLVVAAVFGWTALRAQPAAPKGEELATLRAEVEKLQQELKSVSAEEALRLKAELGELRAKLAAIRGDVSAWVAVAEQERARLDEAAEEMRAQGVPPERIAQWRKELERARQSYERKGQADPTMQAQLGVLQTAMRQLERQYILQMKHLSEEASDTAAMQQKIEALRREQEQVAAERLMVSDRAVEKARQRLAELRETYQATHPDVLAAEAKLREMERMHAGFVGMNVVAHEESAEILARQARMQREIDAMRGAGVMTPRLEQMYKKALEEIPAQVRNMLAREPAELESQIQTMKAERQRRELEAVKRFSTAGSSDGAATPRGRVYIENGPPDEIEKYADGSEAWRYRSGLQFKFE